MAPLGVLLKSIQIRGWQVNGGGEESAQVFTSPDGYTYSGSFSTALTVDASRAAATLRGYTVPTPSRYMMLRALSSSSHTPAANAAFQRVYEALAVYGSSGLATYPTADATAPYGVRGADVVRDLLKRWAPLLDRYMIDDSDGFVMPQCTFDELTTANDAIQSVNLFYLNDWGVYDRRRFFWRPPTQYRKRWIARRRNGARLNLAGDTSETAVNGVLVSFTDTNGNSRTAGPVGANCDYTDAALGAGTGNVVDAHGIPRKWGRLSIDVTVTPYSALQVGARWMENATLASQKGSVVCSGVVEDADTGALMPAWSVRAGDSLRFADADNVERRVTDTSYTHDSHELTATVDNLPVRLDALIQQIGAG